MYGDNFEKFDENISFEWDKYISSIRKHIYRYLDDNDITIREFIDHSQISKSTLSNLLYGNPTDCKLSTIVPLAKTLGISVDELIDSGCINETSLRNLIICRSLPENAVYLIRWFIQYQVSLCKQDVDLGRTTISVMNPDISYDGVMKVTKNFTKIDISSLDESMRCKIFFGLKLNNDHFMPIYTPYDILLLAHDRNPFPRENVVILVKDNIFLARRRVEDGIVKYYGVLDDKYRADESGVTEVIGYVAAVISDISH